MSIGSIRSTGPLPRFSAEPTEPEVVREAAGIQAQLVGLVREHDSAIADLAADRRFTPEGKRDRHGAIVRNTYTKLKTIVQGFRRMLVDPRKRLAEELRRAVTVRNPTKARSEGQLLTQAVNELKAVIREERLLKSFEKLDKVARVKLLQDAAEREDQEILETILFAPAIGEDLVPYPRVRREAQLALATIKAPALVDQLEAFDAVVHPLKRQTRDVARGLVRELGLDGREIRRWLAETDADERRDIEAARDGELFPIVEAPTVPDLEAPSGPQAS